MSQKNGAMVYTHLCLESIRYYQRFVLNLQNWLLNFEQYFSFSFNVYSYKDILLVNTPENLKKSNNYIFILFFI